MTDKQCDRCGEVNPAEIHTCTPKQAYPENFIDALRYHTAISEQPEPEPVAWMRSDKGHIDFHKHPDYIPLYTAPPQREWQGLTDEERLALWSGIECDLECLKPAEFARAIEAKLKEKNG